MYSAIYNYSNQVKRVLIDPGLSGHQIPHTGLAGVAGQSLSLTGLVLLNTESLQAW